MQAAAQRYCVSQQGLRSGRRAEERPQSLKWCVVINHKTTKFESNSQLSSSTIYTNRCCYQSLNYKIWKQFTTSCLNLPPKRLLLSITKLQNLKAIHNLKVCPFSGSIVVINHKTTKFESNSQPKEDEQVFERRCYQSQNYKIWKLA